MNLSNTKAFASISRYTLFSFLLPLPFFALADNTIRIFDTPSSDLSFTSFANKISDVANVLIPFLIGLAFIVIIWGLFNYIRHAGDAEKVAKGREVVVYGIVGLFMMLSFWGFVMIIKNSLFGS